MERFKNKKVIFGFLPKYSLLFVGICLFLALLSLFSDYFLSYLYIALVISLMFIVMFYIPERFQDLFLHLFFTFTGVIILLLVLYRDGVRFTTSCSDLAESLVRFWKSRSEFVGFFGVLVLIGLFGVVRDLFRLKR